MKKWRIKEDGKYKFGEEQDAYHLFACPLLPIKCRKENCLATTDILDNADCWEEKEIQRLTREEEETLELASNSNNHINDM